MAMVLRLPLCRHVQLDANVLDLLTFEERGLAVRLDCDSLVLEIFQCGTIGTCHSFSTTGCDVSSFTDCSISLHDDIREVFLRLKLHIHRQH